MGSEFSLLNLSRSSVPGIVRSMGGYVIDGGQRDGYEYQDPSNLGHARYRNGHYPNHQMGLADEANEDHFGEWSENNSRRQSKTMVNC